MSLRRMDTAYLGWSSLSAYASLGWFMVLKSFGSLWIHLLVKSSTIAGVFISHFTPQIATRDKDVYFIMQTGLIHLKDTWIINIISLDNRTSTCMKETQN